jgi:transposase-like protein
MLIILGRVIDSLIHSAPLSAVELIIMARKSRYSPERKAEIVAESNEKTLGEVAKAHGISVATLSIWRRGRGKKKRASKKKTARKGADRKVPRPGKRPRAVHVQGVNIETLADDLQLAGLVKAFIQQLGYVKR